MTDWRARREALELSQVEAATRAGVSFATWGRWERDPESVKPSTRAKCEAMLSALGDAAESGTQVTRLPGARGAQLLTVAEVAVLLRCSKAHVYRLVRDGAIRTVDISSSTSEKSKTRFFESDVLEFESARADETPRRS